MKGSFRIICLKNDESRKYRDERFKNSNIIVSQFDGRDKKASESLIPNLVHLSARLQDDSHQQKRPQSQGYHQYSNRSNPPNSLSIGEFQNNSINKAQEVKRIRQLEIQKFFEEKQLLIQNQKNTMKNLLGSINFSANKHKEKKISRLIKDACTTQRSKKMLNTSQMSILPQNKPLLQEDFQNFLANKAKGKQPPSQDIEDIKLKRLSKVNPEQEIVPFFRQQSIKPLNLFHFLNKESKQRSPDFRQKSRNQSTSNVKLTSLYTQARIEKKMFNLQSSLKTEQQQFQWSKLKDKTHKSKNFTLRTLDL